MKPQILIGSVAAGGGKTVFTMGLLKALRRRGRQAQPFKCGPDCFDAHCHAAVCGSDVVNLDTWLASPAHVQRLYNRYGERADVCVVEGAAGLFDGFRRMQGSSAEVARLLGIPVVLVVDARSVGYSVAPVLYGFKRFHAPLRVAGVVFNAVTSPSHFAFLREACTDAGLECLGYLPADDALRLPPRYGGLTQEWRRAVVAVADRAAELIERHVAVDKLLSLSQRIFPCRYALPYTSETNLAALASRPASWRIAVARDPAFCLTYHENLARLSLWGGQLHFFSPLYGSDLPEADLVYLPGGYPELFARQLHRRRRLLEQLRDYAESGGRVLAECGGLALLSRSLTARQGKTAYPMAGVLPLDCTMADARLQSGYRRMVCGGLELRGYEYHYSAVTDAAALPSAAVQYGARGTAVGTPLYRYKNVVAGYTRLYWGETDLPLLWAR